MLGNDISDEVPPRILVHVCDIFTTEVGLERLWLVFPRLTHQFEPDLRQIAYYDRISDKGIKMELFHFEDDGFPAQKMFDALDGLSHPFGSLRKFRDSKHVASFLDYSRDVRAVIDPLHPLAYGGRSYMPMGL